MTRTPLFKKKSKNELREMVHDLSHKKCTESMWDEIYEHESRKSKESQLKFLNKFDLTMIIYSILQDEIKEIDETPLEDVPKLLTREWSVPELKERVNLRMKGGV